MPKKPTKTMRKDPWQPVDSTNEFIGRYTSCSDDELMSTYNRALAGPGWMFARARCIAAIREEFYARGIELRLKKQQ